MNRTLINHSALVLSVAMATAWPLSPALADKGGTPHERGVHPKFGLAAPSDGPFPSDRFTIEDETQNTCERVNLPGECKSATVASDCLEIGILNQLDGFNIRPRLAIPFSGDIRLSSVNSDSIYLIKLGNLLVNGAPACVSAGSAVEDDDIVPAPDAEARVGIDQGVWDPDMHTLYVEAAKVLDQHTRYALFVTRAVKDVDGESIATPKAFRQAIGDDADDEGARPDDRELAYRASLRKAVALAPFFGLKRNDIAVASVFTTMSVTSVLEKIHAQIDAAPAPVLNFRIARAGTSADGPGDNLAVFNLSTITQLTHNRQLSVDPTAPLSPNSGPGRLTNLRLIPGAVAQIAFATYPSPSYLTKDRVLPSVGTYSGTPVVQKYDDAAMVVFIPSEGQTPSGQPRRKPRSGWPVIIFGHGASGNILNQTPTVGAQFAAYGFATVVFNLGTAGFGPKSSLTVTRSAANGGAMTVPLPGRGVDVNGNGIFDGMLNGLSGNEGYWQAPPANIYLQENTYRQTVIDVMQFVHVLKKGVDIEGDGNLDLDGSRLYYCGVSAGANAGMILFALEPDLRAAVFSNVGGWGPVWNVPALRGPIVGRYLDSHDPRLLNAPDAPVTSIDGVPVVAPFFNENLPSRGKDVLVNDVKGAVQIQKKFEQFEWISNEGQPGAFAVHLHLKPLAGVPERPFLIQTAVGDQTVTNDSTKEMVDAGLLADHVTLYRHDLFALNTTYKEPHGLLIAIADPTTQMGKDVNALALLAQAQVAQFFWSDGMIMPDPDGAGVLFEAPASFIPEGTNFIH